MNEQSSTPEANDAAQKSLAEGRALDGSRLRRYADLASNIEAYHPDLAEFDALMDSLYDM